MPTWEDAKWAAQCTYINAGNGFQERNGFGQAYRQFLLTGQLDSRRFDHRDVHTHIAQESYQPTATDWKEYEQYLDDWNRENPPPEPTEADWNEWTQLTSPEPDAPELG